MEDDSYESSSENFNMPPPLRKVPKIHHVPSIEHASFNPNPATPCSTFRTPPRPVCRWLTFSPSNNSDTPEPETPTASRGTPDALVSLEKDDQEEEEDFQTVSLDDNHWTTKIVPDRTLCIHIHNLLHGLCPYLCPYANYLQPSYIDSMDLSDTSKFEDIMIMSSNEDIPPLEDSP